MRIDRFFLWIGVFWLGACSSPSKSKVSSILDIPEPEEWILVIHPEGCKTCLDSFYSELQFLPKESPGAVVLIAKNSKTLRLHTFIENFQIPLYLDEQKLLIKEGLVQITDQILLFRKDDIQSFDILDYQKALQEIR
ncbi:hypothetical protein [Algoriphagus confluentis]|uniref:Uncharacterized protein n=1 Tax=Algoriphagus confluentis TaxID=1697556 RepID=A0ABQ6PTA2_9BACT|nr:hypothetical protein Aconfl_38630 [Algoriphagus confluentis]